MPKTHQFTEEQYQQVIALRSEIKEAKIALKLQVLQLRMEGYRNEEIARITGYSKSRVSALVCIFANEGIDYFREEQRKGGNRRNLTIAEEADILSVYREAAEKGQIVTVKEIEAAYIEAVGHPIGSGQIYRVLKRHEWRKVMPRGKHPKKASEEVISTSKKLTLESEN